MALSRCSFGPIMGTDCSVIWRDAKKSFDIIPLTECQKEISNHESTWCFSGVESEEDLISARAGIFYIMLSHEVRVRATVQNLTCSKLLTAHSAGCSQ